MSDGTDKGRNARPEKVGGLVRARVEYNKDPLRTARVKVRIPGVHGAAPGARNYLDSNSLPWASPSIPGVAGEDLGTYDPPPVGTWVWIMYEDGDDQKLVYMGSLYNTGQGSATPMNDITNDTASSMGTWNTTPGTPEVPADMFDGKGSDNYPARGVIYKSQKGHTIVYDDTDGEESFSIIDRVGQIIKFDCPVSVGENAGNGLRRGTANAIAGTQLKDSGVKITVQSGGAYGMVSPHEIHLHVGESDIDMVDAQIVISVSGSSITITPSLIAMLSAMITEN